MYIMIYSPNLSPSQLVTYVAIDTPTFPPQRSINCHSRHFNFLYQFLFFFLYFWLRFLVMSHKYFSVCFHFLQLKERQASSKALNALYFKSVQKLITENAVSCFLGTFAVHLKKLGALWISLHRLTAQLYNDNENTAWQQKPCNG